MTGNAQNALSITRDERARPALGHLPIAPAKRKEHAKIPVFPSIDEAYRITGRTKTTTIDVVSEHVGSWYVVKTSPSLEKRAVLTIEQWLGFPAYVPDTTVWHKIARRNGRSRKVRRQRCLLPGYAFVRLAGEKPLFEKVRQCDGVRDFIYENGHPGIVPMDVVAELWIRETNGDFDCTKRRKDRQIVDVLPSIWQWIYPGATGVVEDGPFASFDCRVEAVDMARFRAKVGVSIFGRMTAVDVEFDQIRRA